MRWWTLLFVAACGRIGFDAATLAADDVPFVDDDGDGIDDTIDNCPAVANPDQHDEDGDSAGDLCDPCPPFPDVDDPDGDGVAGRCDPHPGLPGDVIAHFAGFQELPPDLVLDGSWQLAGDQLAVTGSLDSLAGATWIATGDAETVSTSVTIDAMFGNNVARPIGVVHEFDATTRDGTTCVFGINPQNLEVYALADNGSTGAIVLVQAPVAVGDSSTFASSRSGIDYSCTAGPLASPMTGRNNLITTPNRVGLHARSSSATFAWAMVVTSP